MNPDRSDRDLFIASPREALPMAWIALLVSLVVTSCTPSSSGTQSKAEPHPAEATVEVSPVLAKTLETTVQLQGELTPYESVAIYPRVTGYLEAISVDRGDRVRQGQLLAQLSAPELLAQRAEAEAKMYADKDTLERLMKAADTPGAVAKHDIELAEQTFKADSARVQSLKTLEGYLSVTASFDGIITERNAHPGALVGPPSGSNMAPMLRLEQVEHLRLTAAIPEAYVGAITERAKAEFSVLTWPGEKFFGVIRRISHSVDTRTRTMPVEIDVDNQAGRLASGMYAEISWPVRRNRPSLFVPSSAIVQTAERTFVVRVKEGIVEQVPIQRGVMSGDGIEIFGPLLKGDLVARHGTDELRNGAHVSTRMGASDGGSTK